MRRSTVLSFGVAIALLPVRAADAAQYTLTISGTIDSGLDVSGVFGRANASLDGAPYSLSITIDRDRTSFADHSPYNLKLSSSDPRAALVSATVNGVSYTQHAGTQSAGSATCALYVAARNEPGGSDQGLAATAEGTDDASEAVSAELVDTNPSITFVPNLTLNQSIQHDVRGIASEHLLARFSVDGRRVKAHFTSASAVTVRYGPSDAGALAPGSR